MAKVELKNRKTRKNVDLFLSSRASGKRYEDAVKIKEMMQEVVGEKPAMWGESIVGFGDQHLRYASGRELDWFKIGFSVRKDKITLYLTCDLNQYEKLLEKLGTYKRGVGCLYIKQLADVDESILKRLMEVGVQEDVKIL